MYFSVFSTVALVVAVCTASPIVDNPVTCQAYKGVEVAPKDVMLTQKWNLYASLSQNDNGLSFTYALDQSDPMHYNIVRKSTGGETKKIEVTFQKYHNLVVYYDNSNELSYVVKFLFFNKDTPSFCFYSCSSENPDNFLFMRCYGGDDASTKNDIETSFAASNVKLSGTQKFISF